MRRRSAWRRLSKPSAPWTAPPEHTGKYLCVFESLRQVLRRYFSYVALLLLDQIGAGEPKVVNPCSRCREVWWRQSTCTGISKRCKYIRVRSVGAVHGADGSKYPCRRLAFDSGYRLSSSKGRSPVFCSCAHDVLGSLLVVSRLFGGLQEAEAKKAANGRLSCPYPEPVKAYRCRFRPR